MAQPPSGEATTRPSNANQISIEACRADDVSLMDQAIFWAAQPGSRFTQRKIIEDGLKRSARRNSLNVLEHLLVRGADVKILRAQDLLPVEDDARPSRELLEMVVTYGWDVNPRQGPGGTEWPLLWFVVKDIDLVKWCLDHGARVDVEDDPPIVNPDGTQTLRGMPRPTILGAAAEKSTVEIFELLRARAAPMDPRTLHLAVERATLYAPEEKAQRGRIFAGSMDMVRYLVEIVELDINADGRTPGSHCTRPICYVARRGTSQDFRELVFYLLDHGADPDLGGGSAHNTDWPSAVKCAQMSGNKGFLQAVEEWRARSQGGETTV